jgi:hypothetical protein
LDFLRNLISTTKGKVIVVCFVLFILYIMTNRHNPDGARGNDIAKVAEHAVVYQGVRQGMNALFKSHGERRESREDGYREHETHREYRHHDEEHRMS